MNNVDSQYLNLLQDILDNGTYKNTRAGEVLSVFGRMMHFNLKEGLPILTTKKVFSKGCIHELLWFLKGSTNIKYLVENNVHIWDDDAYRYYTELVKKNNEIAKDVKTLFGSYEIEQISKEDFLGNVLEEKTMKFILKHSYFDDHLAENGELLNYTFGDLGPVYGKSWRNFGTKGVDQIQKIIDTLKNNPDDRRMLCVAFNPDVLDEVALPPCHTMFQFYTRELTPIERLNWLCEHSKGEYDEWKSATHEQMDELKVPRRELSCSYYMRSNDWCCGQPFNAVSYSLLTYMMAEVCNMTVGELVYFGGDIHIYCNHIKQAKEQLSRKGSEELPKLKFARKVNNIFDFEYDDFIIEGYKSDPPIKYQLNVGS